MTLTYVSAWGRNECSRKRFGTHDRAGVIEAANRTIATANMTRWLGRIFSRRRRQKDQTRSPGRDDQHSTNPLRMKKNETPMYPALLIIQARPSANPSSANGLIDPYGGMGELASDYRIIPAVARAGG